MKLRNQLAIATITTILWGSQFSLAPRAIAQVGEQEIDQNQVIAVAVTGGRFHNLVLIEQIPGKETCWNENGSQPTVIDPLWTTFDFTNG